MIGELRQLLRHRKECFSEKFSEIVVFMPNDGRIVDRHYVEEIRSIVPSVRIVDDFSGNLNDYDLFKASEIKSHRLGAVYTCVKTVCQIM